MKNLTLLLLLLLLSFTLHSQSFRVPKNVLSISLYQPFAPEGGYSISYERMIDPGYSVNAAQFSYKINTTFISSTKKKEFTRIDSQVFFDEDAYQFLGYSILPELKYYFTWDAPMGVYINIFGSYTDYTVTYSDVTNDAASYEKKFSKIGRGIGAGFQFKIYENYTLDIIGGYHPQNINSKTKSFGSDEFVESLKSKDEKIYFNINFGLNF